MKEEGTSGIQIPLHKYRKRVLAATGISKNTLYQIVKEAEEVKANPGISFSSPRKQRPRRRRVLDEIMPEDKETIRRLINDFYIIEQRVPTLNSVLKKIRDIGLPFNGSRKSLWKLIKQMGFRWRKTQDNRKILMERHEIRVKRIQYLEKITEYRKQNRPIIYTDETYIHSSHSQSLSWCNTETSGGLMKPIAKGQRLIIVHAGGADGFVPSALLIFTSGKKSGDYHSYMNHENFMKWVQNQLLPNLSKNAVLVVDNAPAPYHNVLVERTLTSASRKAKMQAWLRDRGILFDETKAKPMLYELIKQHGAGIPAQYRLDALLKEHGHEVLRLPPYHPQLNPIELMWATVKNWVAAHNTTFKIKDVEELTRQKFERLGADVWGKLCKHVEKLEKEMSEQEGLLDNAMDTLAFMVNTGSSEESEDSSDSQSD